MHSVISMLCRRDFMKSGCAAFAVAAAGRAIGSEAPSNRVRMAVVGCHVQGRGFEVIKQALKVPGVDIACVCDVDERARDAAAALVVKLTGRNPVKEKDFRKVLEMDDIDAVVSETPDHFHAYSAVMAMRAGKHVWVEKPCAYCPHEGEVILDVWRQTGKVFQMGSQRRSSVSVMAAMEEIRAEKMIGNPKWGKCWYMTDRGPIGNGKKVEVPRWLDWDLWQGPAPRESFRDNIVHYNWHWFKKWGTGECGNNAVHFVDIARWCLGEDDYPVRVTSGGGRFWIPDGDDWEWPDSMNVTYTYGDGRFITWEGVSCVNAQPYHGVSTGAVVYGDKGSVFFAPGGDVVLYDVKGEVVKSWNAGSPEGVKPITNTDNRTGGGWHDSTSAHFGNFVDAIRAGDPRVARAHAEIGVKSTYLALVGNIAQLTGSTLDLDSRTGRPSTGTPGAKLWAREYEKGWELA